MAKYLPIFLICIFLLCGCVTIANIEKNVNDFEYYPAIGLGVGSNTQISNENRIEILFHIPKAGNDKDQIRSIWTYIRDNFRKGEMIDGAMDRNVNEILKNKDLRHCGEYGVLWTALLRLYGIPCEYIATKNLKETREKITGSWTGHVFIYVYADRSFYLIDSTRGVVITDYDAHSRIIPIKIDEFADEGFIEMFRCIDISSIIKEEKDYRAYLDAARSYFEENQIIPDSFYKEYSIYDNNW